MNKRNSYNILIGSYFDPLGHPIFADKIAENIRLLDADSSIRIFAIDLNSDKKNDLLNIFPIKINFLGKFFSYSTKKALIRRLGKLGIAIFYLIRLIVISIFYFKVYKKINKNEITIDLEFEPIQDYLINIFYFNIGKRINIIHSFEYEGRFSIKMFYKKLSLFFIRRFIKKTSNNKIGLMNNNAFNAAVLLGFPQNQLVLAGWGYDAFKENSEHNIKRTFSNKNKDEIKILSFGLIRSSKMLNKISELFCLIDNSMYQLNIIGKSIDNEVEIIEETIKKNESNTVINIEDRYVEEQDIGPLILDHDIMLISHEDGFTSISGPLLLAFQYNSPVLCFSKNTVKDLVNAANAGIVLDLENTSPTDLLEAIGFLYGHTYSQDAISKFQWKEITKRLILN